MLSGENQANTIAWERGERGERGGIKEINYKSISVPAPSIPDLSLDQRGGNKYANGEGKRLLSSPTPARSRTRTNERKRERKERSDMAGILIARGNGDFVP